ncbi:hypothetical protein MesoLj131c_62280 [Mesorhizobium sp. 131-3-5]|nr:hypothetical protein MesoLj131c_62280 [Mesorhizobium sp. 131-3-5]
MNPPADLGGGVSTSVDDALRSGKGTGRSWAALALALRLLEYGIDMARLGARRARRGIPMYGQPGRFILLIHVCRNDVQYPGLFGLDGRVIDTRQPLRGSWQPPCSWP